MGDSTAKKLVETLQGAADKIDQLNALVKEKDEMLSKAIEILQHSTKPDMFCDGVPLMFDLQDHIRHLDKIREWKPFKAWLKNLKTSGIKINYVNIQSIDMFGQNIGFMKCKCDAKNKDNKPLPGIVFMRGNSVAILILIQSENKVYTVLVKQDRVPVGQSIYEIPAGMLDNNTFKSAAVKELHEEVGITIRSDSEHFTELSDGVYPSPGGSDECISLCVYRAIATPDQISKLNKRQTGETSEDEHITVFVETFDEALNKCKDMKFFSAIALYIEKLS